MLFHRTLAAQHPLCPRSSPILKMTWASGPFHGTHNCVCGHDVPRPSATERGSLPMPCATCSDSRPCFYPASKRLLQTQRLRNKLSLLSSCKLQQGSVEQSICAGRSLSLPAWAHGDADVNPSAALRPESQVLQ